MQIIRDMITVIRFDGKERVFFEDYEPAEHKAELYMEANGKNLSVFRKGVLVGFFSGPIDANFTQTLINTPLTELAERE